MPLKSVNRRLQQAIEAGTDPVALVDPLNRAQRDAEAARAVLDALPPTRSLDRARVEKMIDQVGDLAHGIGKARNASRLYEAVSLEMTYRLGSDTVEVTADPMGRDSACVRGGSWAQAPHRRSASRPPTRRDRVKSANHSSILVLAA